MKEGPKKFLTKTQIEGSAQGWQSMVNNYEEGKPKPYGENNAFQRIDTGTTEQGADSINGLHGVSFVEDIIPTLISKKKKGEKVAILDIGAGAAFFTDQIRKKFGDKVKVFSTGLSKKIAREYRKENKQEGKQRLHSYDLKWRSILELSDFPEFDLIIDTYGELAYLNFENGLNQLTIDEIAGYFLVMIKKLKPGGLASLAPIRVSPQAQEILKELGNRYSVKFNFSAHQPWVLQIEKK